MDAEINVWCWRCVEWGFMVFDTDGGLVVRACPKCGEFVTATVNVQYGIPFGVSTEGAAWAAEGGT